MSLPMYREYKDSGVSWLQSVPAHWSVLRLKYACMVFPSNVDKHFRDDEPSVQLCNYTDVYYNEKITADMQFMEASASADQIAKFTLQAGDTIITKDSETADDIAIAAYVPEDLPGVVCGYHLSMIRPYSGTSGAFVKRLFDSIYAKARFAVAANGLTRVGLGQYALDNVELPFPPFDEQVAIAAFLDRETAQIDALIAEQEKLIALLVEKRQATVSHAVTKGLNPNAPRKDSDVAWLGEVPAHWKVGKAGFYISVLPGYAFSSTGFSLDDNNVKLLRGINVGVGELKWDEVVYWSRTEADGLDAFELEAGDVVIGMDRPLISTGMRVALVKKQDLPCLLLQRVAKIRPGALVEGRFMMRLLSSRAFEAHFAPETTGVSVPHISGEQIANFVIPVPPLDEQTRICNFLDAEFAKLDALTHEAERAIALFIERRAALISAAVTGQIDVRGIRSQTIAESSEAIAA